MFELLAVQVFIARILGMHGDRHVPQHRLQACRSYDDLLIRTNNLVGELREHGELVLCGAVARDRPQLATIEFQVINLQVGDR